MPSAVKFAFRRPLALGLLLGLVLAGGSLPAARPAAAATLTVTTTGDRPDTNPGDGVCDASVGQGTPCTLRAAIQEANAAAGPDTIAFDIPGNVLQTIVPASPLPAISERVVIDGYTQPGSRRNTAASGTNALLRIQLDGIRAGAGADGLLIEAGNTIVRGLVINRFADDGIEIAGASGVQVAGCFVGTDAAGIAARGNGFGVYVPEGTGTRIGGPTAATRNLISGNRVDAILLGELATGARIQGNLLGSTRTGVVTLGNGGSAVRTFAANGTIGGDGAGEANVMAFNGGTGVQVFQTSSSAPPTGNRILRNAIFGNVGAGIDLGNDGRTPNDVQDPDPGPNFLQNYPVITDASPTSVRGTFNSTPNRTYTLRLFSNPGGGSEGRYFEAGPLTVRTDASGNATFAFALTTPIPAGRSVTATATRADGQTSEFSVPVPVTAG